MSQTRESISKTFDGEEAIRGGEKPKKSGSGHGAGTSPTEDCRDDRLAKARAAKLKKVCDDTLERSLDMPFWEDLAREFGVRLPQNGQRLTTGRARGWLTKIRVTPDQFLGWYGAKSMRQAVEMAEDWGFRSFAGLLLENRDRMLRY